MDKLEISCDVCMDLIPLVQDGVASEESAALVNEHAETCADCRTLLREETPAVLCKEADEQMIKRLRRPTFWMGILLMAVGCLLCVSQGFIGDIAYSVLILPPLGILAVFVLGKRWWLFPASVFVVSVVWNVTYYIAVLSRNGASLQAGWPAATVYACTYAGFALAGGAAFLLYCYALRKNNEAVSSKKTARKIGAGALATTLVLGVLFMMMVFFGNPISYLIARNDITNYVETRYPGYQLGEVEYNRGAFWGYGAWVQLPNSKDNRFAVSWLNGECTDSFEHDVTQFRTTAARLSDEYTALVRDLLKDIPEYNEGLQFNNWSTQVQFYGSTAQLKPDMEFSPDLPLDFRLTLRAVSGEVTPENAARLLKQADALFLENGCKLTNYHLSLENGKGNMIMVQDITPENVRADDLAAVIRRQLNDPEKYSGENGYHVGAN